MTPRPPPATLFTRPATSSADTGSASSATVGSVRPHPDRRTERVTVDISHSLLDSSGRTSLGTGARPIKIPFWAARLAAAIALAGHGQKRRPRLRRSPPQAFPPREARTWSSAGAAADLSAPPYRLAG